MRYHIENILLVVATLLLPAHALYLHAANYLVNDGWMIEYEIDDTTNSKADSA